ncbi:MAG: hypothetical protein WDW36_008858 [Sanguina aurantia]
MSGIYGGDEVNAIVVEIGTHTTKAGYAGDDVPKAVFPSCLGSVRDGSDATDMAIDGRVPPGTRKVFAGQGAVNFPRSNMEILSPFSQDDLLEDWDLAEALYNHAFTERLSIRPEDFAVMLAEPSHNSRATREKVVELMFERFQVPALYLAKAAVLSSFAMARQTSLVVDVGHRATSVTAVQDGYVLEKSICRSPLAGQALTQCLMASMESRGESIRPGHTFKRMEVRPGEFKVEDVVTPHITASFRQYQVEQIAADAKESACRALDIPFMEAENANIPNVTYELPDGNELHIGPDRFKIPELLFQPLLVKTFPGMEGMTAFGGGPLLSLQSLVMESVNRCDVDVRKELYGGVVLTGGSSLFGSLRERLEKELLELGPQTAKFKITAPMNNQERRFSTWIGGSILGSLGSFQQMWMSKEEYHNHGSSLIHRKAP